MLNLPYLGVCVFRKVMHDVVLQKLPVRLILDRAGLVGNDGATHHGSFDLTYLGTLPNIVIMAPSDEVELMNMLQVGAMFLGACRVQSEVLAVHVSINASWYLGVLYVLDIWHTYVQRRTKDALFY